MHGVSNLTFNEFCEQMLSKIISKFPDSIEVIQLLGILCIRECKVFLEANSISRLVSNSTYY